MVDNDKFTQAMSDQGISMAGTTMHYDHREKMALVAL